jgi:hypothetical protein
MNNWIKSAVSGMILERPGQRLTLAGHAAQLEKSGHQLSQHCAAVRGTDDNREKLIHIIGIERWCQRRLQAALGEPLPDDEYDVYRPDDSMGWDALRMEFETARADTIALVEHLDAVDVDVSQTIPHPQYGNLTVLGWLRYIDMHSQWEGKRIK